jgi:hypothetical protein
MSEGENVSVEELQTLEAKTGLRDNKGFFDIVEVLRRDGVKKE